MQQFNSNSMSASREEVRAICQGIREILERVLKTAYTAPGKSGGDLVRGTCLYAAILLKQALERFAKCTVEIKGGGGLGDGGAMSLDGELQGHYWLEGLTSHEERFLADITADQFGHAPVVLLWSEDSWAGYNAGNQAIVGAHVAGELEGIQEALGESRN